MGKHEGHLDEDRLKLDLFRARLAAVPDGAGKHRKTNEKMEG